MSGSNRGLKVSNSKYPNDFNREFQPSFPGWENFGFINAHMVNAYDGFRGAIPQELEAASIRGRGSPFLYKIEEELSISNFLCYLQQEESTDDKYSNCY